MSPFNITQIINTVFKNASVQAMTNFDVVQKLAITEFLPSLTLLVFWPILYQLIVGVCKGYTTKGEWKSLVQQPGFWWLFFGNFINILFYILILSGVIPYNLRIPFK